LRLTHPNADRHRQEEQEINCPKVTAQEPVIFGCLLDRGVPAEIKDRHDIDEEHKKNLEGVVP